MAGDHRQGRGFPPNDLGLDRLTDLEVPVIDQQQQPLPIVLAGDGQRPLADDGIAEAIRSGGADGVLAALGQFERLAGGAVGCRGQRMLFNQFLAGGFADLLLPEDLQYELFRDWLIGGVVRRQADIKRLARHIQRPVCFQADRKAARGDREIAAKESARDGTVASKVMAP